MILKIACQIVTMDHFFFKKKNAIEIKDCMPQSIYGGFQQIGYLPFWK